MSDEQPQRRAEDTGLWCTAARRGTDFWNWVDKRSIDKHAFVILVTIVTIHITKWAMAYIDAHPDDAGADVGMKVGAVMLAWNIVAAPTIKWWFERS